MSTAQNVLKIAAAEIGYSRWNDPLTGTKYGRWFASYTNASYFGQNGIPYCAMFVAWVLNRAGQTCPGMPTASCRTAYNGAKNHGLVLSNKKNAKPGMLAIFNWKNGGSVTDHIGFVEKNCGSYIQTIEGNTSSGNSGSQGNGGGVYRRTRSWNQVYAIIDVPYGGSSGGSGGSTSEKVEVDSDLGKNSITAWQTQIGCPTSLIDGVISGQAPENKKYLPNVYSITWEDTGESTFVKTLQTFLRRHGYLITVDGYLGKNTVTALQQWLRDKCGYVKHAIDGILGANTAANVQNAINAGHFKD